MVVAPPCGGPGCWVGAPSAVLGPDGTWWLAYRRRSPDTRGAAVVVARGDGESFAEVLELDKARFGAESLERPALVRGVDGRWHLYVSCATPGSKHWRIDLLCAESPEALGDATVQTVFPGDARWGVKDPVVRVDGTGRWHAWICCHPLDVPGAEDRMVTRYATSADGVSWRWAADDGDGAGALAGRPGAWDARGARITAVLLEAGVAFYDGRASAEENFSERTGVAHGTLERFEADGDAPVADVRYLDVVPLAGGGFRLFYERPRADGSHELVTEPAPPDGLLAG